MTLSRWPVEPRPGQREKAEELACHLTDGKRVLFSAPTGWGKTITVIAALAETKLLPAVWLVKALTLGKRVAEDVARWGLLAFTAGGREKTCLLKDNVKDVNDFCRWFRYKCPYARLPSRHLNAANFTELIVIGKEENWCPYYAQDLVDCDIRIQNYHRRLPLRAPRVFIVDEAHNLLLPREKTYSISQIVETVTLAKQLGASERLLRGLDALVKYMLIHDGPLDATLYLDSEATSEMWGLHVQGLEHGVSLRPLLDITFAYVEGGRITTYAPQHIAPYRPAVLVSATLPPESELLLGADVVVKVPWVVKPRCTIISDVTTKYNDFDTKMVLKYKKLLIEISKKFKRVLIFAPSERVAKELKAMVHYDECEPPKDWHGLALFRARGRYSEGVDIPADAVVIAGAPYLPPSVGEWLARQMRKAGAPNPVKAAIDMPMLITTLQCVGRAWRDPQRPPFVVLADERFERYAIVLREFFTLE